MFPTDNRTFLYYDLYLRNLRTEPSSPRETRCCGYKFYPTMSELLSVQLYEARGIDTITDFVGEQPR